ncbi:MAG: sensor histidine kinase KdpD [Actinobacteria bacterium]|nr:sensor histidine kinase KdpD [Actinomycetota bacterium]
MTLRSAVEPESIVHAVRRGNLRVYLGAAPGVGKTFAMLNEGHRRRDRGTDVVIGFVDTHGRALTERQIGDLEIMPVRTLTIGGGTIEEMDVNAVIARRPDVVLIDELAHRNVFGDSEQRWQDVNRILDAGIDVITTVNIEHLESLSDVVERITGICRNETIPDNIVRQAEQVELVDMTPEALRRRMAHGNIYGSEQVDAALSNYFRGGNLTALRELSLLWVADQVDVALDGYRSLHGIDQPWETRERIVVTLTGAPDGDALIRRASRIAQRSRGELLGVHVRPERERSGNEPRVIDDHRRLLQELGGRYHEIFGGDVGAALVEFAISVNATQLVLGASLRSRWSRLWRGSVIERVLRLSGPIDVHVISHEQQKTQRNEPRARRQRRVGRAASPMPIRRQVMGWVLAACGVPLLTLALTQIPEHVGLPTALLLYLALVVTTAGVGGTRPAVPAALGSFLVANWYFTPPYHRLTIAESENMIALAVFLGVTIVVSRFVDVAAGREAEAARARSQATTLAGLAAGMSDEDPLPTLLDHLRSVFMLDAAAVLVRSDTGWLVEARSGSNVPTEPSEANLVENLVEGAILVLAGPSIDAGDRTVLNAFAAQLGVVLEHRRLRAEAGHAHALAEANALRSALLQAVSHDLRTPLAAIKASASSLEQSDVSWSTELADEFLHTIIQETDRLTALVGNLLDMSRIQAGVLEPVLVPTALEEVLPAAIMSLGTTTARIDCDVSEALPAVRADAALLERALANVIANAMRFSPAGGRVRVIAGAFGDTVDLRVIDRGPGVPRAERSRVFQPFQRLGDNQPGVGVGLGLAVADGFLRAMHADIDIEDTPGGGATVVIRLPMAR